MAPHSLIDSQFDGSEQVQPHHGGGDYLQEYHTANFISHGKHSHLRRPLRDEVHDLICVGFGPASLAIAVALHDRLDKSGLTSAGENRVPKVLFLEKQNRFAWHAGMLLPGAKMQISFVKDMATLRDPTSKFTFLNYLHENDRLVDFTNLGTFFPARAEYEDYLRWCAEHFDDVVQYNNEVLSVSPATSAGSGGPASTFTVQFQDNVTGLISTRQAKNVLLAIGGQPSIPRCLPSNHPRIIHSSQYAHLVPKILNNPIAKYRVAVVGAGQSAAEIFNNIQNLYPNSQTSLIMRSEFLKPSDDSPFVNSIFNPSYVDSLYSRSTDLRHTALSDARATNYGVVRLDLIEHLYERMYDQRRKYGPDETNWPHRILGATDVVGFDESTTERPRLVVRPMGAAKRPCGNCGQNDLRDFSAGDELLDVDLVIAATGYQRNAHLKIMQDIEALLPSIDTINGDAVGTGSENKAKTFESRIGDKPVRVGRDYSVQFAPGKVAQGSGIWLQGCCEGTHGLSDTLLSILAVRSQEIVNSVFGNVASK